jgi:hypothetical protein
MRYQKVKLITLLTLGFFGIFTLVVAFFAFQLHLDNNVVMGKGRISLAIIGAFLIIFVIFGFFSKRLRESNFTREIKKIFQKNGKRPGNNDRKFSHDEQAETRQNSPPGKSRASILQNPWLWATISVVTVIIIFFWYITGGKWTWFHFSQYYDMLASAFSQGSLSLLEKPSTKLLSLPNPYDYNTRVGANYIWDVSLFHGKYYLYWGPAPAVIALIIKLFQNVVVEDQYLVMLFMSGLAITMALLFFRLRSLFFPKSPVWIGPFFTLVGMLCLPMLWVINRPSIYEAAICGGIFFLILGVYFAFLGLTSGKSSLWFFLSGTAWGLAIASRMNQAAVVGWFAATTVVFYFLIHRKTHKWILPIFLLGLPVILIVGTLGWYNFARFGSFLETGYRYQLTGPAFPSDYHQAISLFHIIPNLYNFLLRPLKVHLSGFPFFIAPNVSNTMWPWFIYLPPEFYSTEPITGILQSIPVFWLALIPIFKPILNFWYWANEAPIRNFKSPRLEYSWVWWSFLGGTLIGFASLSIFLASNMRYLVDIVPLVTVLTYFCVLWGFEFFRKWPALYRLLILVVILLGSISIAIGLFASFNTGMDRFALMNPHLYRTLVKLFSFR